MRSADLAALAALDGRPLDERGVTLLSPVTRNQQFVCQGANYRQHMIESGVDPDAKTFNMIFTKASSCIVPANQRRDPAAPRAVPRLRDRAGPGAAARHHGPVRVTDENLHEFVAGVVIVNDYSARDVQIPQMQFYKGKWFRTFGPVGPYLCLLDRARLRGPENLDLQLTVNGKFRQRDTTANLVYAPGRDAHRAFGRARPLRWRPARDRDAGGVRALGPIADRAEARRAASRENEVGRSS